MREIIFRGKRIDNGEWVEGFYAKTIQGNSVIFNTIDECPCGFCMEMFDSIKNYVVIPETVGQYTGLTDKNGKKIFEGDIIVIRSCREHPVLVKFIEFSWQCVIPNVDAYIHYRHRLENNDTKYEVIGNIHDNPELIKEAKKDGN